MAIMKARIHFKERSPRPERPRYPPYQPPERYGLPMRCSTGLRYPRPSLAEREPNTGRSSVVEESDGRWSMAALGWTASSSLTAASYRPPSQYDGLRPSASTISAVWQHRRDPPPRWTAPYRHSSIEITTGHDHLPTSEYQLEEPVLKTHRQEIERVWILRSEGRTEMHFVAMDHRGTGRRWVLLPLRCETKTRMEGMREIAGEMPIVATDTDTDEYRRLVGVLNAEVERECY
ncbi:hypothetical protein C8F01DRAFT_1366852 [Mycena amicta]|nr:hypothetical protein C8F01DRAFT_1366852 [Mycena amicta]